MKEEVELAVQQMKKEKASKIDALHQKRLKQQLRDKHANLMKNSKQKIGITPIHMKKGTFDCNNYSTTA